MDHTRKCYMNTIKWGIVGPGNIANKFAKAIKNVDGACLWAVASRSPERGSAFAEKYQIQNVFTSYEEMAESDVDAVYIATPHPFHKPCAEIFLKAKKHVLCEKPVCVNVAEATRLKDLAEENGVFLMEGMWTRFLPAIAEAVKIAKSGEIGDIKGVDADFCYSTTPEEEEKLFLNGMAGGSLLDVGIYCLNFVSLFLGNNPKAINSTAEVDGGVDLHTSVVMQYDSGAIAHISSAINTVKPETAFVYGTKGYIRVPQFYGAVELFVNADGKERYLSVPSIGDGFEEEIYETCSCIRAGKTQSDIMPMTESIEILKLMDIIREQIGVKYPFDIE